MGIIVPPGQSFYLITAHAQDSQEAIKKIAKIGYEKFITATLPNPSTGNISGAAIQAETLMANPGHYSIIDVRNPAEAAQQPAFTDALNIPLPVLKDNLHRIPTHKPLVVHCAAGYRSAAASSIIAGAMPNISVFDLGEDINKVLAAAVH